MSIKRNWLKSVACMHLALLAGCATGSIGSQDFDGDGTQDGDDCDPSNASIYPGADDPYGDTIDQDCDGVDGDANDLDNDGTANEDDCAPEDADIYPGAEDPYGDTIDQDCDGADGDANDLDNDGTANEGDCAPEDAAIYPGAVDTYGDDIDQDCDGLDGVDSDGDGYASTDSGGDDCNDGDAGIHPGADDPDDAIDQDCDGFGRQTTVDLRPDDPTTSDELYLQVVSDSAVLGITWFLDGVERTEYSGFQEIPHSQTSRDQTWRVDVTPYSASGEEGAAASDSVIIGNSAPSAATLIQGLVPDPKEGDMLTAIASASDDDLDTVTMLYGWFVNGVQVSPSPAEQLDSTHFDKGDSIYVVLTPSDGSDEGTPVTSNTVTAVNTAPLAVSAALAPTEGTEETTFVCTISGWQDPDPADSESYDFQWYVNGVTSVTTASLDGASFERGDTVRCEATPNDGEDTGSTLVSSVVTVDNTLPSISSVSIDPTAGDEGTTFTCLPAGWVDPDPADATPDYSFQWYVGAAGSEVASVTTETIDGASFDRDDSIYCEVTPINEVGSSLPAEAGTPVASAALVVANTVPQITSASIDPTGATTSDTLYAYPGGWTDADGDGADYLYQWWVEAPSGNVANGGTDWALASTEFVRGDSITLEVTPTDGTDSGSMVTAGPVVIANNPPTAPVVEVTPSQPTLSDPLTCSITAASADPDVDDGTDNLSYEISWFEGSTHQPSYDVSSTDTSGTSVVPANATAETETWTCEVTPSDSEGAGPVGEDSVTLPAGCGSLSFDGIDDRVTVGSGWADIGTGDISIAFWLYRNSDTNMDGILSRGAYPWLTFYVRMVCGSGAGGTCLVPDRVQLFMRSCSSCDYQHVVADIPLPAGAWHHVVIDRGASGMRVFLDGTEVSATETTVGTTPINYSASGSAYLGTISTHTNHPQAPDGAMDLDGALHDVRIYNRLLSEAEVGAVMAGSLDASVQQGLVAHWALNDGVGTTAADSTGNGYDGSISGGAAWAATCSDDDSDADGYATWEDCDDNDGNSTVRADDADCDGVETSEDCDDSKPTITACPTCNHLTFSDASQSLQTSGTFDWGSAPVTEMTAEAWIRSDASTQPAYATIAKQHFGCNASNSALIFGVYNGTELTGQVCTLGSTTTSGIDVSLSDELDDGLWHHVAYVWESGQRTALYIDGVLAAESLSGVANGELRQPSLKLGIGRLPIGQSGTGSQNFVGSIGPLRLSTVARYESAIFSPQTSYTADADTAGLYAMSEGSGLSVADATGVNPTTVTGAAWAASCPAPAPVIPLAAVPAGTFEMGCTAAQQADGNCGNEESPTHAVTLSRGFWMGETEVTQEQWFNQMGTSPSNFSSCGGDCPVESVSWHDTLAFANALSTSQSLDPCYDLSSCSGTAGSDLSCSSIGVTSSSGSPYDCDGYRLPTEAEWEYAARAGTDLLYAGSDVADDVAWHAGNTSNAPQAVGQKLSNDHGLYDMSGNVWEWTWDWYGSYSSTAETDPEGPSTSDQWVTRGGSWNDSTATSRISRRGSSFPGQTLPTHGFRIARTVPGPPPPIAWWQLDGDGTDATGNGFNGSFSGSISAASNRLSDSASAIEIDAPGHVSIGDVSTFDFDGSQPFSISAWIAPDPLPLWDGAIVSKYSYGTDQGFFFSVTDYSSPLLQLSLGANTCRGVSQPGSITYSGWVHVAGVYDPNQPIRLFIDGEEISSYNVQDTGCTVSAPTGVPMVLGKRTDGAQRNYDGLMDEVKIWDQALTAEQVQVVYSSP